MGYQVIAQQIRIKGRVGLQVATTDRGRIGSHLNDLWLANLRPRQCRTQNSILPPQHTDADRFMRRKSAIHIDDLPGDDARRGRGQKHQYAREIIGFR